MIQLKFEPTISTYMFMQHVHVIRYLKIPCKPFTINDVQLILKGVQGQQATVFVLNNNLTSM